jgi:excisionase family DNA binding protein
MAELRLGRSKVYGMLKDGTLPVVRFGRAVRVPADALEGWIASQCSVPGLEDRTAGR